MSGFRPDSSCTNRPAGRRTDRTEEPAAVIPGQKLSSTISGHERLAARPSSGQVRKRRARGAGQLGLTELLSRLSPRDIAVLDLVGEHRFLTSNHIESFCFNDHSSRVSGSRVARRVLSRLERDRLVERTQRRIGGLRSGSTSSTWMLTSAGQRLRSIRSGHGAVGKVREPGERFVAHYLAIADVRLALVQAERAGCLGILQSVIEPRAWRRFTSLGGTEVLKPDLFAITALPNDEFEDHWFVEVDRATESLPTVLKQCERYEAYRRSGEAETEDGVFPVVVWVVPDGQRAAKVAERIVAARNLDAANYRVTTPDALLQCLRHEGGDWLRGSA